MSLAESDQTVFNLHACGSPLRLGLMICPRCQQEYEHMKRQAPEPDEKNGDVIHR